MQINHKTPILDSLATVAKKTIMIMGVAIAIVAITAVEVWVTVANTVHTHLTKEPVLHIQNNPNFI